MFSHNTLNGDMRVESPSLSHLAEVWQQLLAPLAGCVSTYGKHWTGFPTLPVFSSPSLPTLDPSTVSRP